MQFKTRIWNTACVIIWITAGLIAQAYATGLTENILKSAAIPVISTNPDSSEVDLEFLKAFIGEAPIVVLGESQHLMREQYLLKHRLTRFLVEKMGFRHIAIEDSFFGTIPIDDYIRGADISPANALEKTGGWYLWDTEEMLAFITWLRIHNSKVPGDQRVTYTGIDIEDPWPGIEFINNYFTEVDNDFSEYLKTQQNVLKVFNQPIWFKIKNSYAELTESEIQEIGNILKEAEHRLQECRKDYINAAGQKWFKDCVAVVVNLQKSHQYFIELQVIGESEVGIREKTMFRNIVKIVESGGKLSKTVIWVHNAHAAKSSVALLNPNSRNTTEMELLGTMLGKKFGSNVRSIGMASLGTKKDDAEFKFSPKVLDHVLAETGQNLCFLDILGLAMKYKDKNPLTSEWRFTADMGGSLSLVPSEAFDGIFFIKYVTGARHSAKSAERMTTLF